MANPSDKRKRGEKNQEKIRKTPNKRFRFSRNNPLYGLFTPNNFKMSIAIPEEILIVIFKDLISTSKDAMQTICDLSKTCEQWRQIIIDTPRLWERFDLKMFGKREDQFPQKLFEDLLQNHNHNLFRFVRHLDFTDWDLRKAKDVMDFLNKWRDHEQVYKSLIIRGCSEFQLIRDLFTKTEDFRKLDHLDISALTERMYNSNQLLSAELTKTILQNTRETLTSLNVSENFLIPFSTWFYGSFTVFGMHIEVLDLSNVNDLGIDCPKLNIKFLQISLRKLRILRAANILLDTSSLLPTELKLNIGFPHLEELSIPLHLEHMNSANHFDETLYSLLGVSPKLKLLDIRWSKYITPVCLEKCLTKSIRHLFLSNCKEIEKSESAVRSAFEKWGKSLVELDLAGFKSKETLECIISAMCESSSGEKMRLKHFDLNGSAVSMESLKMLLDHCDSLETINLESCRQLPRGMKRLYNRDEIPQLKKKINSNLSPE